jgi:hypothetical protein
MFHRLNTLLATVNIIISTDLKSLWILINGRFKFATDEFCPIVTSTKIEGRLRGDIKQVTQRSHLGFINLSPINFIFCFLHAKLLVTETLLKHQIRSTYDYSQNKAKSLRKWQDLLIRLTGNLNVRVKLQRTILMIENLEM